MIFCDGNGLRHIIIRTDYLNDAEYYLAILRCMDNSADTSRSGGHTHQESLDNIISKISNMILN